MPKNDRIRLRHMLERQRSNEVRFRTHPNDLDTDYRMDIGPGQMRRNLSAKRPLAWGMETKERNPQIPWAQIIAMRNRLVHLYFGTGI